MSCALAWALDGKDAIGGEQGWEASLPVVVAALAISALSVLEWESEGGCGANVGNARMRLCRVVPGLQEVWEVTEVAVECRQAKKWKGPWPASRDAVGMSGERGATAGAARS